MLFNIGEQGKSIFGWAWMINSTTCKDYLSELAKDIKDPKQRIDILKNPDTAEAKGKGVLGIKRYTVGKNIKSLWGFTESLVEKTGNFIIANDFTGLAEKGLENVTDIAEYVTGSYAKSRNDNDNNDDDYNVSDSIDVTPDAYPYDEPFINALYFKRKSPFTGFHLGRQPSAIGLCTNSKELCDAMLGWNDIGNLSTEYIDNSSFSSENETYVRSESRFFLKEKSAPLWLNSIEKEYGSAQGT